MRRFYVSYYYAKSPSIMGLGSLEVILSEGEALTMDAVRNWETIAAHKTGTSRVVLIAWQELEA